YIVYARGGQGAQMLDFVSCRAMQVLGKVGSRFFFQVKSNHHGFSAGSEGSILGFPFMPLFCS
ncbi:hypothetical protein C5167_002641, partial [Papaver somniferum]